MVEVSKNIIIRTAGVMPDLETFSGDPPLSAISATSSRTHCPTSHVTSRHLLTLDSPSIHQVYLEGQQLEIWRDELLRELKTQQAMRSPVKGRPSKGDTIMDRMQVRLSGLGLGLKGRGVRGHLHHQQVRRSGL